MAAVATHGLMLWGGKSKGRLANIVNLTREQKPVVVFVSATKAVHTLRNESDLSELIKKSPVGPTEATLFNPAG